MTGAALPPPPPLRPGEISLFLDVDGTLVEIEREPDAVHVPDELCRVLDRLKEATGGALALISGRSLQQLDRLFSPLRLSMAGLHGLERRNLQHEVVRAKPDPELFDRARHELGDFAARHRGVLLEDKGLTLALHYRNAPERREEAEELVRAIVEASQGRLILLDGKMVFELKPPGADKGLAIATMMREPPFEGRRAVFAGDDVTDEAGFEMINEMGGVSIFIGDEDRPTAADHRLPSVAAMQKWLADFLEEGGQTPGKSSRHVA